MIHSGAAQELIGEAQRLISTTRRTLILMVGKGEVSTQARLTAVSVGTHIKHGVIASKHARQCHVRGAMNEGEHRCMISHSTLFAKGVAIMLKHGLNRLLGKYKWYVLLLALPFLLGAEEAEWIRLAESDLAFAKYLTDAEIKFGPQFLDDVIKERVAGCRPRPSKIALLDQAEVGHVEAYIEYHCKPWHATWSIALEPCDGLGGVPEWCKAGNEELAAEHLKCDPYFETATATLRTADSALDRYNIMALVVHRLGHRVLRSYPFADKAAWATDAVLEFLESAPPNDAMAIGWSLLLQNMEGSSTLGEAFRSYSDNEPGLSGEVRQLLHEIARGLEGEILPAEVADELRKRFGPKLETAVDQPPDRTDPSYLDKLVSRVNEYHRLVRDGLTSKSWELLSVDRRERTTLEDYTRTQDYLRRHGGIRSWQIVRIQVRGDIAKVFLNTQYDNDSEQSIERAVGNERATFWVYESDSWYRMLPGPPFWEHGNPIDVPIPAPVSNCEADE